MRFTAWLGLVLVLCGCDGSVSEDGDATVGADTVSGVDATPPDSGATDVPADSPADVAPDAIGDTPVDAGPPPEFVDIPDGDIEVERGDAALRRFEYEISDLDPEATSQPSEYFSSTLAAGFLDTRVEPRGELMVWFGTGGIGGTHNALMASYGYHVVQVPYANGWFREVCSGDAFTPECRGNMRLEALTGMDLPTPRSDGTEVVISRADSAESRLTFILRRLAEDDPTGDWDYFLKEDGDLYWEAVAVSGGSHGASTSTRFAVHRRLARAVPIVGPRDQLSNWQSMPSATPPYRIFGFTHEDDARWDDPMYPRHYDRSWDLLGMTAYGENVYIEDEDPPYSLSRQILTRYATDNVHSGCMANGGSPQEDGEYVYRDAWRYIYTHPVTEHVER